MKEYLSYGDVSGINGFNAKTLELRQQNKTSLDLFSKGEVYMVIGYPSLVNRIKEA
ncbi:MAG: hypothetical protein LBF15_05265 [Candidatus Peribacteria bacterium]|nr:hypothetical protein [Candidatus Peribacteria bacterium]